MKKLLLALMVLVGICFSSSNAKAEEARTIAKKHGVAKAAQTNIIGNGGTLYRVSGYASSGNCTFSIHDSDGFTASKTSVPSNTNVLAEGGEASQYDSFPSLDFGDEGIPFTYGISIVTTTCDVAVTYN